MCVRGGLWWWSVMTTLLVAVRHGSLSLPVIYLSLPLSLSTTISTMSVSNMSMLQYRSFNIYYNCDIYEYNTVLVVLVARFLVRGLQSRRSML